MEDAGVTRPRIEDDPEIARLLRDYASALEAGGAPDRGAILGRRPEAAAEIAVCLDGLDFLHGVASHVRDEAERASDALPPAVLGDFQIGREIGRGGMGVVYEADQISLGRRVALKVLPFAAILDPRRLQRFRNEAQAAAHLHHGHIVPVHAVGCERGVHYYAMQLIDGTSLEQLIEELRVRRSAATASSAAVTPITDGLSALTREGTHESPGFCRAVARLGVQAAQALDYAHQQGVVHRDVKPGNLMVDAEGEVWITDFGLAMVQGGGTALTRTGDLVGTLRYMSPELAAAGRLPIDHRTDIYSLGVTLYELLTLHGAFPGEEPNEVLRAIASHDPTPARRLNRAVPAELETILRKSMSKAPSERYASAREMADDLERFLEHRPILARPPSPAARAAKWARRHRGLVAAAIVVLLVGSAALAVGAVRLAREEHRTRTALEESERQRRGVTRAVEGLFHVEDGGYPHPRDWEAPLSVRPFLERVLGVIESLPTRDDSSLAAPRMELLEALGRDEEALAVARRTVLVERDWAALWNLASALDRTGRLEEALAAVNEAIATANPKQLAKTRHLRAAVFGDLGQLDAALDDARAAVSLAPTVAEHQRTLSAYLVQVGRYAEALDAANRAVELNAKDPRAFANRGAILHDRFGRYKEALADFDRAVEIDGNMPMFHFWRGNSLGALGYSELALASYDRALEIAGARPAERAEGPSSRRRLLDRLDRYITPGIHGAKAGVLVALRRFDQAFEEFAQALTTDPDSLWALRTLVGRGCAHMQAGHRQEALADFQRGLRQERGDPAAWASLAECFLRLERVPEAVVAFDRGLAAAPRHPPSLLNQFAWILATTTELACRDPRRAAELAREAVDLDPKAGEPRNTLGVALCRLGSWKEALEALQTSVSLRNGGDPYDWLFMAIADWHLDRKDDARRLYEQSLQWIDEKKKSDDPELQRFRQETATLLGLK